MPAAPDFPKAPDRVRPKRALISLSDKTGLEAFARALHALDVELVSTGGTRAAISGFGLPVRDVAELTGFPEMMDGRVKTLHPKPSMAGCSPSAAMPRARGGSHDLVRRSPRSISCYVVNLYPFEATVARGADHSTTAIENIDIGGPAMIRAAAKNHDGVAVVVATVAGGYATVIVAEMAGQRRGDNAWRCAGRCGRQCAYRAHRRL